MFNKTIIKWDSCLFFIIYYFIIIYNIQISHHFFPV